MSYEEFIESVVSQLRDYADGKQTKLILFVNHLNLIEKEIAKSAEFKNQINEMKELSLFWLTKFVLCFVN